MIYTEQSKTVNVTDSDIVQRHICSSEVSPPGYNRFDLYQLFKQLLLLLLLRQHFTSQGLATVQKQPTTIKAMTD